MKVQECTIGQMVKVTTKGAAYLMVGEIRQIPGDRRNRLGILFPNSICAGELTADLEVELVPPTPHIDGDATDSVAVARAEVQRREKIRAAYVRLYELRRLGKGRHEEAAQEALTQLEAIRIGCTEAWIWNNYNLGEIAKHLGV